MIIVLIISISTLLGDNYRSISTGRPGEANPTSALQTGLYQFEIGISAPPTLNTAITIPMLLRMGFYKNTEWQVAYLNKYLTFGLLYGGIRIIDGLENSIMLTTSLPIPMDGTSYKDNNDSLIEYSAYLPVTYSFQNGFSVSGQISGTFFNNNIDPIISYALGIGSSLDEKTSWFIEAFPDEIFNFIEDRNNPFSVKYGLIFNSYSNNVQFDLSMGLTFQMIGSKFQRRIEEEYIEWGFSVRLPE